LNRTLGSSRKKYGFDLLGTVAVLAAWLRALVYRLCFIGRLLGFGLPHRRLTYEKNRQHDRRELSALAGAPASDIVFCLTAGNHIHFESIGS
jgi:hypothetical protein